MNKKIRKYMAVLIIILFYGLPWKVQASYEDSYPVPDLTGDYVTDLLAVAKSQLGYRESNTGETVYSDWAGQSGRGWCSEFIAWCADQAGIPKDIIPIGTSANKFRNYYAAQGNYYILDNGEDNGACGCAEMAAGIIEISDIEPGDILLIESSADYSDGPDHSSLCLYVSGEIVVTIDGNLNDMVGTAARQAGRIHGVCKPSYDLQQEEPGTAEKILTGEIKCCGTGTDPVTIQLLSSNGAVAAQTTVANNAVTYALGGVAAGTYTLRVSKPNHVSRDYTVTVGSQPLELDAEIWLTGDVNGDGKMDARDKRIIYNQIATPTLEGYEFAVGDVNGDGRINAVDKRMIYNHISGTAPLW